MTFVFDDQKDVDYIIARWNDRIRTYGHVTKYAGLMILKFYDYVPCYVDELYGWTEEITKDNITYAWDGHRKLIITITLPDWKGL